MKSVQKLGERQSKKEGDDREEKEEREGEHSSSKCRRQIHRAGSGGTEPTVLLHSVAFLVRFGQSLAQLGREAVVAGLTHRLQVVLVELRPGRQREEGSVT